MSSEIDKEAQEKVAEMAKAGDLLTENEVKAIAYPLKPYTMKHPPSYVMAVVTQTALKLVNRGYRKLQGEPPLLSDEEIARALGVEYRWLIQDMIDQYRVVAVAQRKAVIKWYGGKR